MIWPVRSLVAWIKQQFVLEAQFLRRYFSDFRCRNCQVFLSSSSFYLPFRKDVFSFGKRENRRLKIKPRGSRGKKNWNWTPLLKTKSSFVWALLRPKNIMRSKWILIGQSFLKTMRTIGDKKFPSRGGRLKSCSARRWARNLGRLWLARCIMGKSTSRSKLNK